MTKKQLKAVFKKSKKQVLDNFNLKRLFALTYQNDIENTEKARKTDAILKEASALIDAAVEALLENPEQERGFLHSGYWIVEVDVSGFIRLAFGIEADSSLEEEE